MLVPLLSPTAPRGRDASLSLASWGCGQDESRSRIFTSAAVLVRSQALPWPLGESQRRGGFWKLRPPAGPRQLVCEGPTARLPSPAPPSASAPPFPRSQEPPSCPPGLGALRQPLCWFCSNTLSFPRGHPPCPAGLASSLGPVPSATACSAQDPCSSRRAQAQLPPVTSAQSGRGWGWLGPWSCCADPPLGPAPNRTPSA